MITKNCNICGKDFKIYPYEKNTAKYCSLECEYKARKNPDRYKHIVNYAKTNKTRIITKLKEKQCLECGKLFNVWNYEYTKRKYCSSQCALEYAYKNRHNYKKKNIDNEIIKCKCGCGKELSLYSKKGRKRQFIFGHNGKKEGKRPPHHDIQNKSIWETIRKQIYQRDNWTCQICNKHGGILHAHHKIPYRISKDNSLNNLITLCPSCHSKEEYKINKELENTIFDNLDIYSDYPHWELA